MTSVIPCGSSSTSARGWRCWTCRFSIAAPGVRLPRGGKVARALCTGIALLLVAVARFCARGCYGGFIIEMCYSAAFIEPRALFLPIAALLALTLIARLCRER